MIGRIRKDHEHRFRVQIGALFGAARRGRVFSGAVLLVAHRGRIVLERAYGRLTYAPWSPRVGLQTVYDLASLTKPLATAPAILALMAQGRLHLETTLGELFDRIPSDKAGISLRHLLSHCSGFQPHRPYYRELVSVALSERRRQLQERLWAEPLLAPPGVKTSYSDLGFMVLGWIVEDMTQVSLDRAVESLVYRPLKVDGLAFRRYAEGPFPGDEPRGTSGHAIRMESVAPTEACDWRGEVVWGEVHDQNAWALGGIAGHAGLFGTGRGVARLLLGLLAIYQGRRSHPSFPRSLLSEFWKPQGMAHGDIWALGFDTPTAEGSSAGHFLSPCSVGHLGFTGTSFWLDLEQELLVVLLTNRTFPLADAGSQERMQRFRPGLHNRLAKYVLHEAAGKGG